MYDRQVVKAAEIAVAAVAAVITVIIVTLWLSCISKRHEYVDI